MKRIRRHLLACLLCLSAAPLCADNTVLYIGIESNRKPYAHLDHDMQASGLLVDAIRLGCVQLKADCQFIGGEFDTLLGSLQTYQLHALLVIDSFIAPEIDQLQLSVPLCLPRPVFLQLRSNQKRQTPEDFKRTTIGVHEGSLLHLYLLDEYSSEARLKPYPLEESGVFDLVTGRIDALLADEVFINTRVMDTVLGNQGIGPPLAVTPLENAELPPTSMRLAVRERDSELLAQLNQAIEAGGPTQTCTQRAGYKQAPEPTPVPEHE